MVSDLYGINKIKMTWFLNFWIWTPFFSFINYPVIFSDSPQTVLKISSDSHYTILREMIRRSSGGYHLIMRQSLGSSQVTIRQSSGSQLAVIWQSSRCQQEIISYSSDNWICLSKKDCQPQSAKILASQNNFQYFLLVTFVFLFCGDYFIYFS